jgi:arylsulfatase A-like enzyme
MDYNGRVPFEEWTLAEVLKAHGYRTAAFTQNPNLDAELNFDQGFDRYIQQSPGLTGLERNKLVDRELGRLAGGGAPLFLFIHYQEPHYPYKSDNPFLAEFRPSGATPEFARLNLVMMRKGQNWDAQAKDAADVMRGLIDAYDASIRSTDEAFADLLRMLRRHNLFEDSIIILNSDHGDEFFDRGRFGHAHANVHSELTRVPLVMRLPNRLHLQARVSEPARNLDIFPTVLSVLGVRWGVRPSGTALLPQPNAAAERVAMSSWGPLLAVRSSRFGVFVDTGNTAPTRVFDLVADPREMHEVKAGAGLPEVKNLLEIAERWKHSRTSQQSGSKPASRTLTEKLKSLGYVQ